VDGRLRKDTFHKKREKHRKRAVIGDIAFADDTALIGANEEPFEAEDLFKATADDWDVRVNVGKTEELVLVPGGRNQWDVRLARDKPQVRHLGGWCLS
jgi:hypothetical protein